jgi:hypothetical protein
MSNHDESFIYNGKKLSTNFSTFMQVQTERVSSLLLVVNTNVTSFHPDLIAEVEFENDTLLHDTTYLDAIDDIVMMHPLEECLIYRTLDSTQYECLDSDAIERIKYLDIEEFIPF